MLLRHKTNHLIRAPLNSLLLLNENLFYNSASLVSFSLVRGNECASKKNLLQATRFDEREMRTRTYTCTHIHIYMYVTHVIFVCIIYTFATFSRGAASGNIAHIHTQRTHTHKHKQTVCRTRPTRSHRLFEATADALSEYLCA